MTPYEPVFWNYKYTTYRLNKPWSILGLSKLFYWDKIYILESSNQHNPYTPWALRQNYRDPMANILQKTTGYKYKNTHRECYIHDISLVSSSNDWKPYK